MKTENLKHKIAFALYYMHYSWDFDIEDDNAKDIQAALESWRKYTNAYIEEGGPWKDGKHLGDCTKYPMSCTTCIIDDFYRIADLILEIDLEKLPAIKTLRELYDKKTNRRDNI